MHKRKILQNDYPLVAPHLQSSPKGEEAALNNNSSLQRERLGEGR